MCQKWYFVTFYEGNMLKEQLLRPYWTDIKETTGKQNKNVVKMGAICPVLALPTPKGSPAPDFQL